MNRDRRAKISLCGNAARKLSSGLLKELKAAEEDIGNACMVYNQEYEQRLGRPIATIREFEESVTEFSKLPKDQIERLIQEGRVRAKQRKDMINSKKLSIDKMLG